MSELLDRIALDCTGVPNIVATVCMCRLTSVYISALITLWGDGFKKVLLVLVLLMLAVL